MNDRNGWTVVQYTHQGPVNLHGGHAVDTFGGYHAAAWVGYALAEVQCKVPVGGTRYFAAYRMGYHA